MYGGTEKFQNDPYWRDLICFHEYFHAENGAGLGASHQTGWTGVIAYLMKKDYDKAAEIGHRVVEGTPYYVLVPQIGVTHDPQGQPAATTWP